MSAEQSGYLFLMHCPTCQASRLFDCHLEWRADRPKPKGLTPFNTLDVLSMHNHCVCTQCGSVRPTIELRVYETLIQEFANGKTDVLL